MSRSTNLHDLFKDNIEFHYMCSLCEGIFINKSEYNDHSSNCTGSKQNKLNKQDSSSEIIEIQNSSQCQKFTEEKHCINSINGYEISSKIISENELLITLKGSNNETNNEVNSGK